MRFFLQDLRYGTRWLLKNPGFTLIAVITLALGVGATSAIFSVVNGVLLRPLPFKEPDRLVTVYGIKAQNPAGKFPLCQADYLDWQAQNQVFEHLAAYSTNRFNYSGGDTPEQVQGAWVTADFFNTLGSQPALGRTFLPDEDRPQTAQTVVISDGFWRRYLGANPAAIDQPITLNNKSFLVIGVMPAGFSFPEKEVEFWAAERLAPPRRGPYYMRALARLRPDTTLEQVKADVKAIAGRIEEQSHGQNFDDSWTAVSLAEATVGDIRTSLLILLGAVVFVLLIASANVANLMLSRATAREKEMAIRLTLGASRGRLLRQMLTESLLLAMCGGTVGLLLAVWGVDLLLAISPLNIPRLNEVTIDYRVLGFTLAISMLSGLIFGLAPALQNFGLKLNTTLKESGRGSTEGRGKRHLRGALIIAEVALALVLLVGAGLMIKSFVRLHAVSPGFKPDQLLTMQLTLPRAKYDSNEKVTTFYEQLLNRVNTVPGVQSAALSISLPPNNLEISDSFTVEGKPLPEGSSEPIVPVIFTSPDYFSVLGVPLLDGRLFNTADKDGSPLVVIINKTLADAYFPNESAVGRRLKVGGSERNGNPWMEIVGVVGDIKYNGLESQSEPAYYTPLAQTAWRATYLVVHATGNPMSLAPALRREVWAIDKDLPVAKVATMEQLLSESIAQPRFHTLLLGLFAGVSMLLAAIGIYGVIAYAVSQRTQEIGIRMALGAGRLDVVKLVVKQGMATVTIGMALGLAAALALTRLMEKLLFEVKGTDLMVFVVVSLILAGVALAACLVPARRATRVDPIIALRSE
jgi:putative ABC transport system permease protein